MDLSFLPLAIQVLNNSMQIILKVHKLKMYPMCFYKGNGTATPQKEEDGVNSTGCGADSFMINDGVCDEATNIEKCLFDGDDCCIQDTDIDTTLCRDCICKLHVSQSDLMRKFKEHVVHIHLDLENSAKDFKEVKVINNVANEEVCA